MSLAYTPDRLRLPESLQSAVARVSPPGLDDQDGRGRRRGGLRHSGRLPAAVLPGSRCGTRRAGCALRLFAGGGRRLREHPAGAAPLGLAASPAGTTGPAAGAQAPAGRRPVAGHHRAGAQRLRAGPVAGALRGGHPRGRPRRPAARFSRLPFPTLGTGSGLAWWPCRS